MLIAKDAATADPPSSWIKQIRSLTILLCDEFGVPFRFYDAATGRLVDELSSDQGKGVPAATTAPALDGATILRLAALGVVQVLPLNGGRFQLALPFADAERPATVAVGVIAGLGRTPAEISQEQVRLGKWLHSVHLRLIATNRSTRQRRHRQGSDQGGTSLVGLEAVMSLEHLLRTQRIEKAPGRNRRQILNAAAKVIRAQTLLWVPADLGDPELEGEPLLCPSDCGQLIRLLAQDPECARTGYFLNNEVQTSCWGGRFPQIVTLLAVPVPVKSVTSWVIALNKSSPPTPLSPGSSQDSSGSGSSGEGVFRRTHAALLLPFAALLGVHLRASRRHQQSKDLLIGMTRSLAAAVDVHDTHGAGHSERVARIAVELARELGLQEEELSDVYLSGLLHDIGKIALSDAILRKSEPLTAGEFSHLRQHVSIGSQMLAGLHSIAHLLPAVLHHHERYDGTGYPDGLKGEAIPLLARIVAVAESYDAIATARPERVGPPRESVEEILTHGADLQWDGRVIAAFFRCRDRIRDMQERWLGGSLDIASRSSNPDGSSSADIAPINEERIGIAVA